VRVRTEPLEAQSLVEPGISPVSLRATLSMVCRCIGAAPFGWLRFGVCFLPRALLLVCAYVCNDGDGRMRTICALLAATSAYVPRKLEALQMVTDIAPLLPALKWVQLDWFGGGGVETCQANALAGGGEWLWPTPTAKEAAAAAQQPASGAFADGGARPPLLEPPFARRRLVLYIHGGAFVLCNPATHRSLTGNLARHLGVTVLATTYRRPPAHAYPDALDGLLALYRNLLALVPAHGLILAGESAGGNLALALCLRAAQLGLPLPAGLLMVSPWVDLGDYAAPSWARNARTDYLPVDLATLFAEAYAGALPLRDARLSPLFADDLAVAPRTLVVYGEGECLSDQQGAIVERLREARVPTSAFVCPGAMHGFPLFADAAYWNWNARAAAAAADTAAADERGGASDGGAPPSDAGVQVPLRAATRGGSGALPAPCGARFDLGETIDAHADATPGALRAFAIMRDFAEDTWRAAAAAAAHAAQPEPELHGPAARPAP
jgi:acetyl esterase/lipase